MYMAYVPMYADLSGFVQTHNIFGVTESGKIKGRLLKTLEKEKTKVEKLTKGTN